MASKEVLTLLPDERRENYDAEGPLHPYQLEFVKSYSGKFVKSTKRRITWVFGFANEAYLADGRKGIECRENEYSVRLVWSILSGKQLVQVNGQQVFEGVSDENIFDYSWSMYGIRKIEFRIIAVAYLGEDEGERGDQNKYKLFVNDQLYHTFPNVYNIGHVELNSPSLENNTEVLSDHNNVAFNPVNTRVQYSAPVDLLSFESSEVVSDSSGFCQGQMIRASSIGSFGSAPDTSTNALMAFDDPKPSEKDSTWNNEATHPLRRVLSLDGDFGMGSTTVTTFQGTSHNYDFWSQPTQNQGQKSSEFCKTAAQFHSNDKVPNFDFGTGLGLQDSSLASPPLTDCQPNSDQSTVDLLCHGDDQQKVNSAINPVDNPLDQQQSCRTPLNITESDVPLIDFSL